MENRTIPDTTPEQSGTTGGSGAAGRDAPNFCEGRSAEQPRKYRLTVAGAGISTFEASSWEDVMREAAEYMGSDEKRPDDEDEEEAFTVYCLPKGSTAEIGDYKGVGDSLGSCDRREGIDGKRPLAPSCLAGSHDFVAADRDANGNPVFHSYRGEMLEYHGHCRFCGLALTSRREYGAASNNGDESKGAATAGTCGYFSAAHGKRCVYTVDADRSRKYCSYHRGFLDRALEEMDDKA